MKKPRPINLQLVDAQQARRVLDRLVGYKISPLLWAKVRKGLSAGRVQSVATRMIVDREAEIDAFVPQEYWTITCLLYTSLLYMDTEQPEFYSHCNDRIVCRLHCQRCNRR